MTEIQIVIEAAVVFTIAAFALGYVVGALRTSHRFQRLIQPRSQDGPFHNYLGNIGSAAALPLTEQDPAVVQYLADHPNTGFQQ